MLAFLFKLVFVFAILANTPLGKARAQTAMEFPAPLIYYRWWNDTQECLGRTRNFKEIKFWIAGVSEWEDYVRDSDTSVTVRMVWLDAKYRDDKASIYVGLGREYEAGTVRHEMAHAIMRHTSHTHPDSVFRGKCAPLFEWHATVADSTH